jgi:hypothetical protein
MKFSGSRLDLSAGGGGGGAFLTGLNGTEDITRRRTGPRPLSGERRGWGAAGLLTFVEGDHYSSITLKRQKTNRRVFHSEILIPSTHPIRNRQTSVVQVPDAKVVEPALRAEDSRMVCEEVRIAYGLGCVVRASTSRPERGYRTCVDVICRSGLALERFSGSACDLQCCQEQEYRHLSLDRLMRHGVKPHITAQSIRENSANRNRAPLNFLSEFPRSGPQVR